MHIEILNCNNISRGTMDIERGRLNIKYAINGTGKSSIAKAIELRTKGEDLTALTPYSYFARKYRKILCFVTIYPYQTELSQFL